MHHYLKIAEQHLLQARKLQCPELKAFKYLDAINAMRDALPYCHNDKVAWSKVMTAIKYSRKAIKEYAI